MRRRLEELIDFDRLDSGAVRLSVVAVDLKSGAEVVFDTATRRVTVDHLLADGRWLADGGLIANVPVDPVLGPEATEDMLCGLVDLFPIRTLPRTISLEWQCVRPT